MRVLITGISGLIGSHLAEHLLGLDDVEVIGFKRWRSDTSDIAHLAGRIGMLEGDVEDPHSVERAIEEARPDRVFHLAAQSYPSESWDAPTKTFDANVKGTVHVLEALRRSAPEARVLIACSSAEYGFIKPEEVPVVEDHPLRPLSPYGVSKVAQELLGIQYHLTYGMPVYLARFFNQVGIRQDDRCSVQTFAQQVAAAEVHEDGVVRHGNLNPRRDFLDARDGVRALWAIIERGRPGEPYNVCSGEPRLIGDILSELVSLSARPIRTELDDTRLRPVDEPILVGDHSKLSADTGWQPEIPFSETLQDVLAYWRKRV